MAMHQCPNNKADETMEKYHKFMKDPANWPKSKHVLIEIISDLRIYFSIYLVTRLQPNFQPQNYDEAICL